MKRIIVVLIVCGLMAACSEGSSNKSTPNPDLSEATFFQEVRISSKAGLTEGSGRTQIIVNDWRQITRVEDQYAISTNKAADVDVDVETTATQRPLCSGMSLLDETDYQDIVDTLTTINLISYQPQDLSDGECPTTSLPEERSYTVSYIRNDGTKNSFTATTGCLSEEVLEFIDFINAVAVEYVPCDGLNGTATEEATEAEDDDDSTIVTEAGVLANDFWKIDYLYEGAVVPNPIITNISIDRGHTLWFYEGYAESDSASSILCQESAVISDDQYAALLSLILVADLINYAYAPLDTCSPVGEGQSQIAYDKFDGTGNHVRGFVDCMSAEVQAVVAFLKNAAEQLVICPHDAPID